MSTHISVPKLLDFNVEVPHNMQECHGNDFPPKLFTLLFFLRVLLFIIGTAFLSRGSVYLLRGRGTAGIEVFVRAA